MNPEYGHLASRRVAVSAARALAYMADPEMLGQWSLGAFQTTRVEGTQVYKGLSLFGTGGAHVRIESLPELGMIRYWVGAHDALTPRIMAFVTPHAEDDCIVSMMATRTQGMTDERWAVLCRTHETEMDLIKSQLETGFRLSA